MLLPRYASLSRTQKVLGLILGIALVLHVLSDIGIYARKPESISTTPDPLDYRLAALNLLHYHEFSLVPPEYHAPQLLRTPAYPAVVAAGYLVDGETGLATILFQSLLLVGMGWLLFLLLTSFRISEPIALTLTALYLLEPLQWLYTLQTMTETLASFFVLLLVTVACRGEGVRARAASALYGVGVGLLVFVKPSAAMWAPFLLLLLVRAPATWRARGLRMLIAGLFMVATLLPWMIRNETLTGHLVLSSSGPFNLVWFAGTPETTPASYYDVLTTASYNGHSNQVWYAYTTGAYASLRDAQHAILAHGPYLPLLTRQVACAPGVWFGSHRLQNQESYGHEYSLISDFVLGPAAARDHLVDLLDTTIWTLVLLLTLLGSGVLLADRSSRLRYALLACLLLATVFINFCASWVRVLLPVYPTIFLATGAGISFLAARVRRSPSSV